MWTPTLKKSPIRKSHQGLLKRAYQALCQIDWENTAEVSKMRDESGYYAIELPRHFLTARKSTYGDIVSVDNDIIRHALNSRKKILLYLHSACYFYEFDPQEVKDNCQYNFRGRRKMANFKVRLGTNYIKTLKRAEPIVRKNIKMERELRGLCEMGVFG